MKFSLTQEGLIAATAAAGHEGYVIPKDKMLNIIAAVMPHITSVEDGEPISIPQAHTAQFEAEVTQHINLIWMSLAKQNKLLDKSNLKERVRWVFRGGL
jgi:hypothetical protein